MTLLLAVPALPASAAPQDSGGGGICQFLGDQSLGQKIATDAFAEAAKAATQKIVGALFKAAGGDVTFWGQLADAVTKNIVSTTCPEHTNTALKVSPYFTLGAVQSAISAAGASVPDVDAVRGQFRSDASDPAAVAAAELNQLQGMPNRLTADSIVSFSGTLCQDLTVLGIVPAGDIYPTLLTTGLTAMPAVTEIIAMTLPPSCRLTPVEANNLVWSLTSYVSANQAAEEALPPVVQSFVWSCPKVDSEIDLTWQGRPAPRIGDFELWEQVGNGPWQYVNLNAFQTERQPGQVTVHLPIGTPWQNHLFAARVIDQDQNRSGWSFMSPALHPCLP